MFSDKTPSRPRRSFDPNATNIEGTNENFEGFNRNNIGGRLFYNTGLGQNRGPLEDDFAPDTAVEVRDDVLRNLPSKEQVRDITGYSIPASIPNGNMISGLASEIEEPEGYLEKRSCCCSRFCGAIKSGFYEFIYNITNKISSFFDGLKNGKFFGRIWEKIGGVFLGLWNFLKEYGIWLLLILCIIPILYFLSKYDNKKEISERDYRPAKEKYTEKSQINLGNGCFELCENQYKGFMDKLDEIKDAIENISLRVDPEVGSGDCEHKESNKKSESVDIKKDLDLKKYDESFKKLEDLISKTNLDLGELLKNKNVILSKFNEIKETITKAGQGVDIPKGKLEKLSQAIEKLTQEVKGYNKKQVNNSETIKNKEKATEKGTLSAADTAYNGIYYNGKLMQNLLTFEMGCDHIFINKEEVKRNDRALKLFNNNKNEGEVTKLKPISNESKKVVMIEARIGCGNFCDAYPEIKGTERREKWPGLNPIVFEITNPNYNGSIEEAIMYSPRTFRVYDITNEISPVKNEPGKDKLLFEGEYEEKGDDSQLFNLSNDKKLDKGVQKILIVFDAENKQNRLQLFRLGLYGTTFEANENIETTD